MQKISDSTSTANASGEFTEGNPVGGIPATLITAVFLNCIQRELVNVVEGAGLELNPDEDVQLLEAIKAIASGIVAAATTEKAGVVELATDQEGIEGLDKTRAIVPAVLSKVLTSFAKLNSPTFTGVPQVPTAALGTDTDQAASTAFVQSAIAASPRWAVVASGYVGRSGDRIMLNNRVDSPILRLPAEPLYGQEIQVMPYPYTQYSRFPVMVEGNGNPIMGLNETMVINEDNVMCSCKFLGKIRGWILEKMGYSGNSFTLDDYTARAYGPNAIQKFDARIVKGAPLVMMVHGGGWVSGDRAAANLGGGVYLQQFPEKYGFGFASIEYTLATSAATAYPTAVNDVIAAADYFKNTLGVTDIHILGTSAGANLAALAVIARPDLFSSFIGYYGAYDLTQLSEFSADVQTDIGYFTADPSAASPTLQAGTWNTPALLIHGDADTTVNIQQTLDFGAAIGVNPITVAGAAHAFPIFGDPAAVLPGFAKSVFKFIDGVSEQ